MKRSQRESSYVHRIARKTVASLVRNYLRGPDASEDVLVRAAIARIAKRVLKGQPKDGQCCQWERRDMNGGCLNCGDPCL